MSTIRVLVYFSVYLHRAGMMGKRIYWSQQRCKHHLAKPNIVECSLRLFLQRKTQSVFKMFIAPLETDSKFIHSAVANSCL